MRTFFDRLNRDKWIKFSLILSAYTLLIILVLRSRSYNAEIAITIFIAGIILFLTRAIVLSAKMNTNEDKKESSVRYKILIDSLVVVGYFILAIIIVT